MSPLALGALASLAAGLATGIGALPVLLRWKPSPKLFDGMLGFAAGVMLAATFFSLLLPAVEAGGPWRALVGFLAGVGLLVAADRLTPHLHFPGGGKGRRAGSARSGCSRWPSPSTTSRKGWRWGSRSEARTSRLPFPSR